MSASQIKQAFSVVQNACNTETVTQKGMFPTIARAGNRAETLA